jgi:hypothetical protein
VAPTIHGVRERLYATDGDRFIPSGHTRGPWDPDFQHGGAPAALLARAVEATESDGPMQVARLTYELLRPVPLAPLRLTTEVVRPGRKVQLVQASLQTDDTEVVRVTALRIRAAPVAVPEGLLEGPPEPGPEAGVEALFPGKTGDEIAFHRTGMEVLAVRGGFGGPGPGTVWFRLRVPVVDDEEPSPVMRVAAAADFGNGISWVLPPDRFVFINPDLTVHLSRPPDGEWICLDALTVPGPDGAGLAESVLYDTRGRIGRAVQSLLLDGR